MADSRDPRSDDPPLNERILDVLVYIPAGIAVSVVEELPKLAARGRDRLGVRVSSARAVGQFAVKAGTDEFRRRSGGLFHKPPDPAARRTRPTGTARAGGAGGTRATTPRQPPVTEGPQAGNGHIPDVSTLSIPGFDTLSASQVVQRLDGLNRVELVSVRAYEASTRGRRTILNRVDQLLDERS
jgi:hypothetical protein